MKLITSLLRRWRQPTDLPRILIIGIGSPAYGLTIALQTEQIAEVVAFLDDEPWTNKTEILGVTVRYPSDAVALIDKHQIQAVVDLGELKIATNIANDIRATGVHWLSLDPSTPTEQQISTLSQYLSP